MENTFLILSKNNTLLLKHYIFGRTEDFLRIVHECFEVVALNEDVVEVRLAGLNASIYYASEFDVSRKEIEGHILIDLFSEEPYSIAEVQTLFIDFVMKTKSYLFLISDQEEKLILESSNVERLN